EVARTRREYKPRRPGRARPGSRRFCTRDFRIADAGKTECTGCFGRLMQHGAHRVAERVPASGNTSSSGPAPGRVGSTNRLNWPTLAAGVLHCAFEAQSAQADVPVARSTPLPAER